MSSQDAFKEKIRSFQSKSDLEKLWKQILRKKTPGWPSGRAFEYMILRAFELEGALIRWPYTVSLSNTVIEQIDGVIHFDDIHVSILAESKDHSENINIDPIAKIRNQLLRRPSNVVGAVFSTAGFTEPALILSQFCAPQTILLWEKNHIDHCLKENNSFKTGFLQKYRHAIEEGFPNYDVTTQR